MRKIQAELYSILEEPEKSTIGFYVNTFIYVLIVISILSLMLSTVDSFHEKYGDMITTTRNIIMPIFIIEYILRLYASGIKPKYRGIQGKIKYIFSVYALIDLVAIFPYILANSGIDSAFVRSLRLLRIFRLFRVKKYALFIKQIKTITARLKEEFMVLLFYTFILLIVLSFAIFEIEHNAQPDVFSNVFQTMWWAVATLTTVGYGDMYPVTVAGKVITAIITIVGIAFVAIPGGMFASEFMNEINKQKREDANANQSMCPRCSANNIELWKNDDFSVAEKTFNKIYHCQSCHLTWLNK